MSAPRHPSHFGSIT
jgi:hypothetical protein